MRSARVPLPSASEVACREIWKEAKAPPDPPSDWVARDRSKPHLLCVDENLTHTRCGNADIARGKALLHNGLFRITYEIRRGARCRPALATAHGPRRAPRAAATGARGGPQSARDHHARPSPSLPRVIA